MRNIIIKNLRGSELTSKEIEAITSASTANIAVSLSAKEYQSLPLKKDNIYNVLILEDEIPIIDVFAKFEAYDYRENNRKTQDGTGKITETIEITSNSLSFSIVQEA